MLCPSVTSAENLEVGCTFIENAAVEKAVRDIDDALAAAYSRRKQHRDTTGAPYYDMTIFGAGRYPAQLPEPLRPKPGGLNREQLRVYEDFSRDKLRATPVEVGAPDSAAQPPAPPPAPPAPPAPGLASSKSAGGRASKADGAPGAAPLPGTRSEGSKAPNTSAPQAKSEAAREKTVVESFTLQQALERFGEAISEIDGAVSRAGVGKSLASLPETNELHDLVSRIQAVVTQCVTREECAIR